MKAVYTICVAVIVFDVVRGLSPDLFNLTLVTPNVSRLGNNHSIYVAVEMPNDKELFIVDFCPVFDRQKVQLITTYLCSQPYVTKGNVWFDGQPCHSSDQPLLIYEWYYSVPAVQWPRDAGLRVGSGTSYRYVVVNIQYFSSVSNGVYGEHITMTRRRPKYSIGSYDVMAKRPAMPNDHADVSCEFQSSTVQLFSALLYSNLEGGSASLHRVRKNRLQTIFKGNLSWPQTFYQLPNPIDITMRDLLIGRCTYARQLSHQISSEEPVCQLTLLFFTQQDEALSENACQRNDLPRLVDRFLSSDLNAVPQTLFDINPAYPKLSPSEWATMQMNLTISPASSVDNNTHVLYLIYSDHGHHQELIKLLHSHRELIIICIWLLSLLLGLFILVVVIARSRKTRKYGSTHKTRSKAITVGGETSSLSGWLTKGRFQQYEDDDNTAREPLTGKHRWTSDTEGSELSDSEVFNATDFRNVILRN